MSDLSGAFDGLAPSIDRHTEAEMRERVNTLRTSLAKLRQDPAERARIDNLIAETKADLASPVLRLRNDDHVEPAAGISIVFNGDHANPTVLVGANEIGQTGVLQETPAEDPPEHEEQPESSRIERRMIRPLTVTQRVALSPPFLVLALAGLSVFIITHASLPASVSASVVAVGFASASVFTVLIRGVTVWVATRAALRNSSPHDAMRVMHILLRGSPKSLDQPDPCAVRHRSRT